MYLKKLELHGFKSFAHKTSFEFKPGMTVVVGPNGSGKSNVADAIRWVMGEQSLKLLRGKKSEDVIFAGSDKKSKLSVAEVAVTFDNYDHRLPLEFSEITIARRLYRDGESDYLLNNQKVRLFDVVDLLIRSGFGAANYTVIGQGMVDQMVLSGPAEIKNLIEEAAGVKPYYLKREKTVKRLEQTKENLSKVQALIAEIEPRLRSLKRQAKKMEERESLVNELTQTQLKYYGYQLFELESDLNPINHNFSQNLEAVSRFKSQIRELENLISKSTQKTQAQQEFSQSLERQLVGLTDKKLTLQEELALIRGKLKSQVIPGNTDPGTLKTEELVLKRQTEDLERRTKALADDLAQIETVKTELKQQFSFVANQIQSARGASDLAKLKDDLKEFRLKFNETLDQLTPANFAQIKEKLAALVEQLISQSRQVREPKDLNSLYEHRYDLSDQLHKVELKIVELATLKKTLEEQLKNYWSKLNQVRSVITNNPQVVKQELFGQEAELNEELETLLSQISELKLEQKKQTQAEEKMQSFITSEELKLKQTQNQLIVLKEEQNKFSIEKVRLETKLEDLTLKIKTELKEQASQIQKFKHKNIEPDLEAKTQRLKRSLEMIGGLDEMTMQEYKETQERYDYLSTQSYDLTKAADDLSKVLSELDQIIKRQFDLAYNKISEKFSEYFRILFNGGRASMSLVREKLMAIEAGDEELQEVSEESLKFKTEIVGVEIRATPPGKKLSTIASLSGGERALTSIALLCSLLAAYPSPFVVLDEVDAALDEANSIRFAKILATLAHQTQFITITHNRETMRQAHTLYGITMGEDGMSKVLSIKLEKAEAIAE